MREQEESPLPPHDRGIYMATLWLTLTRLMRDTNMSNNTYRGGHLSRHLPIIWVGFDATQIIWATRIATILVMGGLQYVEHLSEKQEQCQVRHFRSMGPFSLEVMQLFEDHCALVSFWNKLRVGGIKEVENSGNENVNCREVSSEHRVDNGKSLLRTWS